MRRCGDQGLIAGADRDFRHAVAAPGWLVQVDRPGFCANTATRRLKRISGIATGTRQPIRVPDVDGTEERADYRVETLHAMVVAGDEFGGACKRRTVCRNVPRGHAGRPAEPGRDHLGRDCG